jgi:4-amino-4-deoxy-L-arabinose transferase-like glycosyltransferase
MLASKGPENSLREIQESSTVLPSTEPVADHFENAAVPGEMSTRPALLARWEYLWIVLVIVLIAGIRFRLRDFPLERDEGEYAYAGQLILQGIPPYQLAYNMKLPGTYAAYAGMMAMFGQTAAGIHYGVILVNSASIFLVFLITRKLFDPTAAAVAGTTFGLFTIRPLLLGLAGHATHFVTLTALASLYLLVKACGTNRLWLFFWSGICSGLALLMKQPGVFFGIFAAVYICWNEWPSGASRAWFWRKLFTFSLGAILPYLATCLILFKAGVFQKFWFWTVSYARAYGAEIKPFDGTRLDGLHQFANRMELQKEHVGLIWFLIVFGMAAFLWDRHKRPHAFFAVGLLAFSFLAISVGFYFRGHYFIMIYPALAILAGVGASSVSTLAAKLRWGPSASAVQALIFVLACANALYAERQTYFLATPHEACRKVYGTNPFPEAIGVGDYIRQHSAPDARVAVLGSEPEIYFYAQRRSATGYIYAYPLVEDQPYARVMQAEVIKEVEAIKPEFFVYVTTHESWLTQAHADQKIFDWAESYINQRYTLEGIADGGNRDVYRWGVDAATYRPRRPEFILVYRRRS